MTVVYIDSVLERRAEGWVRLSRLSTARTGPWFMISDLNEITTHNEKEGGMKRSDSSFLSFNQMLTDCGMMDFPFTGNMLSLEEQRGNTTIRCRLDRAVGNEDWHEMFPHSSYAYLRLWGSDHRPVLAN